MPDETTEPPYRRIAADIRRRIAEGELVPGDRVPSTRKLAEQWGVALATATKALTELRLEGYVETRPRAGTVVAPRRRAAPEPPAAHRRPDGAGEADLTRERVVRAAIEIADTEGLAALSMRGVAARLGVAAMSPYRHVGGKGRLVSLMADAAYGELGYPDPPPPGWRARLELGARTLWRLHRRHPWLAHVSPLTRPLVLPNVLVHGEWLLAALEDRGLDAVTRMDVQLLVFTHVQGVAVTLEREAQAEAATGKTDDEWMDTQRSALGALAASGRYPSFARTLGALENGEYDLDLDALFDLGLTALLDGLAPRMERAARR
ncbi:GntR family transcriptional regulator [Streptomyces roseolilacinus]|uniref:GntR family transcriptional regulator n=1 Tax=Streptomyces roseolilacinus TaxID=66904 RepID=A0A918EHT0_9ACTN|nr:GntR family transcriptional regulator [Streptomyces roseolilacinus]GGP91435.1 GntR family transcriptional regulator [Streptomyces roseolilacinus]